MSTHYVLFVHVMGIHLADLLVSSGLLSPMMALPFGMAVSTKQGFEKFNAELKRKVETGA